MNARAWAGALLWISALAATPAFGSPAERLAAAIRIPTVSHQEPSDFDAEAFRRFHGFLETSYPRVHERLRRHTIGGYSLLYEWPGREPALRPLLLAAHFDVVPVADEQRAEWTHPPFAGAIADGFVWGRGALDDKSGVLGTLEAVEALLGEGFQPRRTVHLAFGHDEEVGGEQGAAATAAWLEERGVRLLFTLDEGMAIAAGAVPGVAAPVAFIGIAEKGYLTIRIVAHASGGHSSVPPRSTAIGKLARAIRRLEENRLPVRQGGVVEEMFAALAPHTSLPWRVLIANRWLFGPLLRAQLERTPASDALLRTTTAVTMIHGGVKENVLPATATATVNFRIAPGDTSEGVTAWVARIVDDPEVSVEVVNVTEPSPVADAESEAWALLERTIGEVAPDAVVAPGLVLGGTDSKHYVRLAENSYRFTPFRLDASDLERIHGSDERLSVSNYESIVEFYRLLLRGADELSAP